MKKARFWGYPRLCLCLFIGLLLVSCGGLKPGVGENLPPKSYDLTVVLPDADQQGELFGKLVMLNMQPRLDDAGGQIFEFGRPYSIRVKVCVQGDTQLKLLLAELAKAGISVQQMILVNN